jgi:outer membrane lipoprotein-sorting protein
MTSPLFVAITAGRAEGGVMNKQTILAMVALTAVMPLACAFAAPVKAVTSKKAAPKVSATPAIQIDPAAVKLLEEAMTAYESFEGLTLKFQSTHTTGRNSQRSSGSIQWKVPMFIRLEETIGRRSKLILSDGKSLFTSLNPPIFYKQSLHETPPDFVTDRIGTEGEGLEVILRCLLVGGNFLTELELEDPESSSYRVQTQTLPLTVIDGRPCHGFRYRTYDVLDGQAYMQEITAWFGHKDRLLHRLQTIVEIGSSRRVSVDKITENIFNPAFATNTFVWLPPQGAKEQTRD